MDDTIRRALVRAIAAFLVVLVVGGAGVAALSRLGDDAAPSPTPSATPSPSITPEPERATVWLAWVPGGLPDDFGPMVNRLRPVADATTATADIAWLVSSTDADGEVIDETTDPYRIPIDTTGVDQSTYASFLDPSMRAVVQAVEPGEALLSRTAADLRGLEKGATLTFAAPAGEVALSVAAVVPDEAMGGHELLVTRGTGEDLGITRERYVVFRVKPGSDATADVLARQMVPLLPIDAPFPVVEVRAPDDVSYMRANDRELPLAALKTRFGEFAAWVDPAVPGVLQIDPAWVQPRIESRDLPLVGVITCHRKILDQLERAMRALEGGGGASLVDDAGDCFEPLLRSTDPDGLITSRDFGAAIDLNRAANDAGEAPDQPDALVEVMASNGFGWGGGDAWAQGSLFRYRRTAKGA